MGGKDESRLMEENIGLVHMIIKRLKAFEYEYEDLLQVGAIGLLKAIRRFDENKGCKFSTFACIQISGEIFTHIQKIRVTESN